ncbi:hypothetical protein Hanom_Chr08g00722401 [Helianthus anomalus]
MIIFPAITTKSDQTPFSDQTTTILITPHGFNCCLHPLPNKMCVYLFDHVDGPESKIYCCTSQGR